MATVVSLKGLPGLLPLVRQRLPLVELVCLLLFVVAADVVSVGLSVLPLLLCVSAIVCSRVDTGFADTSRVGCFISVGVPGVHGGALMLSMNCLSSLSCPICLRIAFVRMTLPEMPSMIGILSLPRKLA